MNRFLKIIFFFSFFLCNSINATGFVNLSSIQTTPSNHQVTIKLDSIHTKPILSKNIYDPYVRQCIASSRHHVNAVVALPKPNNNWTQNNFKNYFAQHFENNTQFVVSYKNYDGSISYQFTPAGQERIFKHYNLYVHPGFREFVRTLDGFESFIVGFKNNLWNDRTYMDSLNTQYNKLPEVQTLFHDGTNSFCSLMCNWFKDPCYKSCADTIGQKVALQVPQLEADAQKTMQSQNISESHRQAYKLRIDALQATMANNGIASILPVELSPAVQDMAQRYDINPAQLQYSYNCDIGNVLHTESIQLINETQERLSNCILKPDVEQCALAAIDYTKQGNISTAMALADVCHVTIDHIKRFGSILADCAQGIGLGVYDAGVNVGSMLTHPVQTAEELVNGLSHVGYYVGKAMLRMEYIETLSSLDPVAGLKERIQFINDIKETTCVITKAVAEKYAATPTREIVRHLTSFFVEGYLTGKTITALGSLCKNAAMLSKVAVGSIKNVVRSAEVAKPVAAGIGEIKPISRLQTWFNEIKDEIKNVAGIVPKVTREVKHILPPGMNLENLKQAYQIISTRFAKTLDFAYEHIFGIEDILITKNSGLVKKSWSGFHHDHMGRMEKSGIVTFTNETVCPKTGAIKADVSYRGLLKEEKTFFPREWSPEKVIEKITEAYNNFQDIPRLEGNRRVIESLTDEGMKIRIILGEDGKLVSAYPLIEELKPL